MSRMFKTAVTPKGNLHRYCSSSPRESWVLAAPDYYTAYQHRGRGERTKVDRLPTLDAARVAATSMLGDYPARPVLIYAVRGQSDAVVETVAEPLLEFKDGRYERSIFDDVDE